MLGTCTSTVLQLCAELKQAQAKASQLEGSTAEQLAELEKLQQRARDLELEMARNSQSRQTNSTLMEELNAERARVIAADKKVRSDRSSNLVRAKVV